MWVSDSHYLVVPNNSEVIKISNYNGELVYKQEGRKFILTSLDLKDPVLTKCYKYKFSDDSEIIIKRKKRNFNFFFTYYNPNSYLKSRIINSTVEGSYINFQRNILYSHYNNYIERFVFYKEFPPNDHITNLELLSKEEYYEKVKSCISKEEGFASLNRESQYFYDRNFNSGTSNPKYLGMSNSDLIELAKSYVFNSPRKFTTVRTLLKYMKVDFPQVPLTLGSFRPSYEEFYDIVWNNREYYSENDVLIDNDLLVQSLSREKGIVLNHVKDHFFEYIDHNKRKKLEIVDMTEMNDYLVDIPDSILIANNDIFGNFRACSGIII